MDSFIQFFIDPVLRAPTLGSMLMCLASSLIGVLVFIRKRSLLGESLSHASYPGVVLSVIVASFLFPASEEGFAIGILVGAFITSLLGLFCIDLLERKLRVKDDAALCFVLAIFFGVGVLIASRLQITHALWYKQIQMFLYGQAATMVDVHVYIYAILVLAIFLTLFFLYRPIQILHFDREFSKSVGIKSVHLDAFLHLLLVLAIVIGIRCVGVVLMSGMLIAPAVAARQFTHRLSTLFIAAGICGIVSGYFGNYLSLALPKLISPSDTRFSLPTGPMILLCASSLSFAALLFAPQRGLLSRFLRIVKFQDKCRIENMLKILWKQGQNQCIQVSEVQERYEGSLLSLYLLFFRLRIQGWIERRGVKCYALTPGGWHRASRIVRLHRLWEVYLVSLGQGVEKVHGSAEDMEHIITPEIEKQLTEFLKDPKHDPHKQPIPGKDGLI